MSPDRAETTETGQRNSAPFPVKTIVSGGFGVGKTTMIGAVSEIDPLTTEEQLTVVSAGIDSLAGVEDKTTTTVAMDFGRLTLSDDLILYLFGTPGQDRYWFTWDDLTYGAVGAVVLIDTRRLPDSFGPVGYFEQRGIPFVVAINEFADAPHHYTTAEVRDALDIPGHVPVVRCDARDTRSSITVLLALVDHALTHPPPPEQPHQPIAQGAST
ncbi:GTP-binding protein [Actinomadura bangladeshensis]|uniref:ATP-binding protein n=1 Tax=Actinomadura bangladeshensis TaxID=453573 RepID=A0A6L9QRV5_9ACTN|nr:ATP/GTP-binding protein [Actinomadura bangladeshensis]NEA27622.1 ATP-binding protein [Actinomadura bangladeshensis]